MVAALVTYPTLTVDVGLRRSNFELDVSIEVPAGTTTALLGPNGAGKSTVIDVIAGLVTPDRGVVRLGDQVLTDVAESVQVPPEQRGLGVVFQRHLLFAHLDVRENVAFGLRARGVTRRTAAATADHWLERLDLIEIATRMPPDLSGGQSQRVAMARALATDPRVLLLDEPLAAVDVATRAQLRRLLRSHLEGFDGPRLLITHDPTDTMLLADQVVVLENGKVVQVGTPDEIRQRPLTSYVAALAGTNLLAGRISRGMVTLHDHPLTVTVADSESRGDVLLTIHPTAVALHERQPAGSPRNVWATQVEVVEPLGDTTRIVLGSPVPLVADITPAAADALGLRPGSPVWASVKATEVGVSPV